MVSSPAVHYTGYHMTKVHWLLLSLLVPGPIAAQRSGTLTGTVVGEESTPLAEARIRMAGVGMVSSDKDGRFRLTGVSRGDHVLEVRRLGYREFLQPVTIRAGETLYVRVVLTLAPVPLSPVEIEGKPALLPAMRGFEERRAHGNGHFFDHREIAQMQPRVVTDVLRRVPGVVIQSFPGPFGPTDMVRMARTIGVTGARPCPVLFYVNGTPFPVTGDISINQYVVPEDILAVEVYSGTSQIPPQFQSNLLNARCGVIVIWTRMGNEDDRPPKEE